MPKRSTNKEIKEQLDRIETKIDKFSKLSKYNFFFALGVTLAFAGITMTAIDVLKNSWLPIITAIMGLILIMASNFLTERTK